MKKICNSPCWLGQKCRLPIDLAIEISAPSRETIFRCRQNMNFGDSLTRSTVWLALTLYVASETLRVLRRARFEISWKLNTVGCICFLGHVAAAFHYFYNWSHAVAYADTARQSKALTGWNSGDGLYLNYLFALVWLSEVIWMPISPPGYSARAGFWGWTVRAFFLFMIFNGAFVFARSNMRWFGLALCLVLVGSWWFEIKRSIDWRPSQKSS
jgi:hypothetical protein